MTETQETDLPRLPNAAMIELSATEAVAAMRGGVFSAESYARALLERCAAGRYLNAFITLEPETVLEAARTADRHRASGGALGLLHGLPVPVKDSVNTGDYPTTGGTNALRHFQPKSDAPAVALLRAAGAIVLGKTNLHELSLGWTSNNFAFGPVRNPYDPDRIAGGSSGGTAAAIAARMAPLGVAADTSGSIRIPAALCGLFGFRPTTARYPTDGVIPIAPLFDQIGAQARCMDDLALFDAVMTGDHRAIEPAPLAGLRLGIDRAFFFTDLDPEVAQMVEAVMALLEAAGVVFVDVEITGLAAAITATTSPISRHDAGPALAQYLLGHEATANLGQVSEQVLSPDVKLAFDRFMLPGTPQVVSEDAYEAACGLDRPSLQRTMAACFADHAIAALLFPTAMVPATPIGADETVRIGGADMSFATAIGRNILPGSTAGLPGLVIPTGLTASTNLPLSIEIDGPACSDRELLGIGMAIAAVLKPIAAPNLLPSL